MSEPGKANDNPPQEVILAVRSAMLRGVVARFMRATSGVELDRARRSKINADLIRGGLDGNGRFRNMSVALSRIDDKLSSAGVQFDEVITAGDVSAPEGRISINLAAKGPDSFSPIPIRNTALAVHWTSLPVGYEVVAYLG